MKDDFMNYVNECPKCHKNKLEHTHPVGLLHSLPIPPQKWKTFPWTSSLVCPKYLVRIAYLWWWIDSLNLIIYLLLLPLSLLYKWLNYFLIKFSDCMGFLRALSVTEIADFLVTRTLQNGGENFDT